MAFERVFTGAPWERRAGYCRAIRAGRQVFVSGTAPVDGAGRVVGVGDGLAQARRCFEIALGALRELGAGPESVVRTRMFVTDIGRWQEFAQAHQECFGTHPPATAMVEVRALIDRAMMIEVEIDAVIEHGGAGGR